MVPAVLDFEASGFGAGSYPIEVGYVLADGRSACYLIRPEADWQHWDSEAEGLHGISRALLSRKGRSVREVAAALNERLTGETLYSDAWGHDYTWMALLFEYAEMSPRFKLQPLRLLLNEDQQEMWDATRTIVAGELALERHRASSDARLLQQTYVRTLTPGLMRKASSGDHGPRPS
jgi:hypothetical protein